MAANQAAGGQGRQALRLLVAAACTYSQNLFIISEQVLNG